MTQSDPKQPASPPALTPEQEKARKRRNVAIFWSLIAFILLIFVVTLLRLSSNISAGA
ncbi:MAG: hypothetical protein ACQRW7_02485 [Caulobacterales bacterium]|uniref:hypothetical protein n=1 Tax=Glycocaulis sp. TaxID=1969725 RepID=UPI003F9F3117